MTKRRSRGEGGLHWDKTRRRWIATVSLGYDGRGKRITKKASGQTKTEAKAKLRNVVRDLEEGRSGGTYGVTVTDAVEDWLAYGIAGTTKATKSNYETICRKHILPELGAYRLSELRATHVEAWMERLSLTLSTRTLRLAHGLLNRSVRRAMARERVQRNVVDLADIPKGQPGRPSKSLTLDEAKALLEHAEDHPFYPYVVVSLLTGARIEEMRALTWAYTHLDGNSSVVPPLPPYVDVWRSVRKGKDTKTKQSRRSLALPGRCIEALRGQQAAQTRIKRAAASMWHENDLVFCRADGTPLKLWMVRRGFRNVLADVPGLEPDDWTPRELRHSFVSILSDRRVPIEEVSQLVGHRSTAVTEAVYRHQIRPVVREGAAIMDEIFD